MESFRQGLRELIAKTMPHSRAAERVGGSQDGEKQAGAVEAKVQGEASLSAKETADVAGNAEGGGKPEDSRNEEKKAETDDKDKQAPASQWVSTWSCQYTSRSFDTVKKQQILDLLTDEVGPSYKVNLKESEFSIIVECNPVRRNKRSNSAGMLIFPYWCLFCASWRPSRTEVSTCSSSLPV